MAIEHHELEFWLSGGAGNTDPAASLGGARSTAQQTGTQTGALSSALTGLTLLYASGRKEATGTEATIALDDSAGDDRLRLAVYPDGNTTGAELTGNTGTATGYLTRRRDTGGPINQRGVARVTADWDVLVGGTPETRNLIVQCVDDNLYVEFPAADYTAGETYYRCFYVLNNGGAALGTANFVLNDGSGANLSNLSRAWGLDPAGVNGVATTIANEHTAPAGVTFSTTDVAFPDLTAGDVQAVWVRITMPAVFEPNVALRGYFTMEIRDDDNQDFWAGFGLTFELPPYDPNEDLEDILNLRDDDGGEVPVTTLDAELVTFWPEDTLVFTDSADALLVTNWPEDELEFTDEVDAILIGHEGLTDSLSFDDDLDEPQRILTADIAETLSFEDELTSTLIMRIDIEDELAFVDFLDVQGDILDGWVINLETSAASRYSWLRFNSLTAYEGDYYGATPDGVYALEGSDDDGEPIEAFVLTQQAAPVDLRETRATRAYLGMKFSGEMVLKTITKSGTNLYSVQSFTEPAVMQRHRVILGGGVRTVYWQFALQNVEGGDFEADTVWVLPIVLSRRFS